MAKANSKKLITPEPSFAARRGRSRPFLGVLCLILGTWSLISVLDYTEFQNPSQHAPVLEENLAGELGVIVAYHSFLVFGKGGFVIPICLIWLSGMLFFGQSRKLTLVRIASLVVFVVSLCILLTVLEQQRITGSGADPKSYITNAYPNGIGGFVGDRLYRGILHQLIGIAGTVVVFGALLIFCVGYVGHDNVFSQGRRALPPIMRWWAARREKSRQLRQARKAERAALKAQRKRDEQARKAATPTQKAAGEEANGKADTLVFHAGKGKGTATPARPPEPTRPQEPLLGNEEPPIDLPGSALAPAASSSDSRSGAAPASPPAQPNKATSSPSGLKIIAGETVRKASRPVPEKKGDYVFPPRSLLQESAPPVIDEDAPESHKATAEILVRTLGEFGVKVTMGEVHVGPVITRYDVYPAAGVRVEKIVNLDKNLALALKALSVRILAPVPGKGCVGIEVPNKKPQSVFIRDIIESEDWVTGKAEIPIALGKEVSGKPLIADLTRMPHLLIAGSTGSGKTVCINAVITSLLYHSSPEDIRFVMVDPKIVEMQVYNSLPHMLIPVVTDPKKVPGALKYLLNEMERRYQMFASVGVRNIAGYNAKQARRSDADADQQARELDQALTPEERAAVSSIEVPRDTGLELPEKIPYIVVIVDELADLMMVAPADVETGIARLAQLARAAGIHLIIATQRPSVNVITGVIKANLPSRISFKVAAKVDSRTILDTMGADHLIGRGDMLFLPPGTSDLVRAQGAFVSDDEISTIVDFLRRNGEPVFDEEFQRHVEEGGSGDESGAALGEEEEGDELIPDALEVLRTTRRASTSMLQRRLKIGYNRAARIMETLEERGYVGPDNGMQPREILRDPDSW